ncbi:ABC1 kinase family protein [Thalassococcus sp. BH17M4-6]|uniref:ABC1 kinase family protein n=1 Tax=Thalassococcus sp. BH17M4-6 TaxID=3413148 RepID=UPI003BE2F6C7
MTDSDPPREFRVPAGRLPRLGRFGAMTTGILGSAAVHGTRQLASGQRPDWRGLLLTPANATRLTAQLSQMRGAAMKMGQLLSMEAGEFLPPELAQILARLRDDAHVMPGPQLKKVLTDNWGADFLTRFARFDVRPIAAASIGQVHRARTRDGRDLAIKVQYPGVRRAIDSDLANVASLLRMSGLLPKGLDLAPFLAEARAQLHEEADYQREGRYLARFHEVLAGDARFAVPRLHADLTTRDILAMDFLPGTPVEALESADQATRDRVTTHLLELVLAELFDLRLMQTDPNFANYRYQADTGRIVLLDFGATRDIPPESAVKFRRLLHAALSRDRDRLRTAAHDIGYLSDATAPHHAALLLEMMEVAFAPLSSEGAFDFGTATQIADLQAMGLQFATDRSFADVPPPETLFLHRKIGGLYLLAARLRARVDMPALLAPYA